MCPPSPILHDCQFHFINARKLINDRSIAFTYSYRQPICYIFTTFTLPNSEGCCIAYALASVTRTKHLHAFFMAFPVLVGFPTLPCTVSQRKNEAILPRDKNFQIKQKKDVKYHIVIPTLTSWPSFTL